jgi:DNA mismatch repair protein MutH
MNYEGKAEQLLLGGQSQTEVPYSTGEQRLAAAQVLALLALAEAIKDLSASIDMGLRGDGGSGIGKAIESALGVANARHQAGLVEAIENLATAR